LLAALATIRPLNFNTDAGPISSACAALMQLTTSAIVRKVMIGITSVE